MRSAPRHAVPGPARSRSARRRPLKPHPVLGEPVPVGDGLQSDVQRSPADGRTEGVPRGPSRGANARETKALAALDCPTIVRLIDVGEITVSVNRCPFIATQFIEGEPLNNLVRRGPLGLEEVARIGREDRAGDRRALAAPPRSPGYQAGEHNRGGPTAKPSSSTSGLPGTCNSPRSRPQGLRGARRGTCPRSRCSRNAR